MPPGAPGGERASGGPGPGGGFNGGQRPTPEQIEQMRQRFAQGGGGGGGFNGGQRPTPEQIEQMRQRFAQGGGAGGFRPGGGNGGGFGGDNQGQPRQRRGTVMVKNAAGELEARQVVIGVTDRIHGQVLDGLKEGEEVVVGKRDETPTASSQTSNSDPRRGGFGFRPF